MPDPAYLALYRSGELARRVERALAMLHECRLCGWECGVDRAEELGPCRTGMGALVATSYIHHGEERPLVAGGGSGAIFFAGCDLRCQFCQTARWNIQGQGQELSARQIARLMLDLQRKGAANINLVTPAHVAPQILAALLIAVEEGLRLPLVWNSGGYDSPETLALLDGIVDIYLPDMKYSDPSLARRLSGVREYPRVNRRAVLEMHRQVGDLVVDERGRARRGLLVRHLVMPGHDENTAGVLRWIAEHLGPNTYLSLMDQYRPAYRAFARPDIGRPITPQEYAQARELAESLGLRRLDDNLLLDPSERSSVNGED
ncbi:MAG TPA: radical SAM protein [Chloroflexi bacterium]|nr:radical SAM protein [Chloroflexota bacterium]